MSDPTDERVELDAIVAQYRAELARLNYVRSSINVYLRSIRRLSTSSADRTLLRGPRGSRSTSGRSNRNDD